MRFVTWYCDISTFFKFQSFLEKKKKTHEGKLCSEKGLSNRVSKVYFLTSVLAWHHFPIQLKLITLLCMVSEQL